MTVQPRILIVEDDLPSAELLKEILEQVNYEVLVAHDGAHAVELAEAEHPDMAIIDVMLPRLNGFEVCQRIRRNPELITMPIVMLTVLNESHHRIRAMQAGANDFLTKPFDRLEMLTKIRSLLGLQSELAQREHFSDIAFCLLTALGNRSPEVAAHAKRVARLSEQLGRRCGLGPDELKDLITGALLHDAGKLAMNGVIPLSVAGIQAESAAVWRKHTLMGDLMLSHFNRPIVRSILRSHHEHMDGTGFPDGLSGEQIGTPVRVVALCNRFDHSTEGRWEDESRRHAALSKLKAEAAEGRWDPAVLQELEQFLALYSNVLS